MSLPNTEHIQFMFHINACKILQLSLTNEMNGKIPYESYWYKFFNNLMCDEEYNEFVNSIKKCVYQLTLIKNMPLSQWQLTLISYAPYIMERNVLTKPTCDIQEHSTTDVIKLLKKVSIHPSYDIAECRTSRKKYPDEKHPDAFID